MINEESVIRYCSEDISNMENYQKAINDMSNNWVCHHRLEIEENKTSSELVKENRYFNRPPSELIFLTKEEHGKIHYNHTSQIK